MVKMFKYFFLFFALVSYGWSAQAQMKVRSYNLNSFPKAKTYSTATVAPLSSVAAQQHPEFGQVPFATQCSQCAEHIDKRTANTRFFTDEKNTQTTYAQQSYFPLHYQPKGSKLWHTIDPRLQNKGLGRYAAPHQPVATALDLNTHTTTLHLDEVNFAFNGQLSLWFFEEGKVQTAAQTGNYNTYTVGEEGLRVNHLWPGITMEQVFGIGEVKTSYVIDQPLNLPIAKGWMVIEDKFWLPNGFTFSEADQWAKSADGFYQGDYVLKNTAGEELMRYEKPIYVDAKAMGVYGKYKLAHSNGEYTLQLFVPIDWLTKPDHTYPITIDPLLVGTNKYGNFSQTGLPSYNMGFTSLALGSCDYFMNVTVPGQSTLTNALVDVEYTLTYDANCGVPALPPPFCTFSQVTMEVRNDTCNTTTGLLSCNPALPPFTGTCTTDPNLVPGASALLINSFVPNYLSCIDPQCPDYVIPFTLKNRDSVCLDQCGYLCARGNFWRMTIQGCTVDGSIAQNKNQICAGEPVTLTANPNCGVPPYHFIWSYGNTIDTVYGTNKLTIYPQQDVIVSCIIRDTCLNFAFTNDLDIFVTPSPAADAGTDVYLCEGGTVNLGGTPTTSPGASVQWFGENATVQSWVNNLNLSNPTAFVPAGIIDTFFYVLRTSDFTCFRRDTIRIYSLPKPFANAGSDVSFCAGGTAILGGNPAVNSPFVNWVSEPASANGWLSSTTTANPTLVVPNGTIDTVQYILTVNTVNCSVSDTMSVFSKASPQANAGADVVFCEGGTATLGGNPAVTPGSSAAWTAENATALSWLSSSVVNNPQVNVPLGTTDTVFYVLNASDATCSKSDTVRIFSGASANVSIDTSNGTQFCANTSLTLSVSGNFTAYAWSNGATTASVSVNQAGSYSVTVTDISGCTVNAPAVTVFAVSVPSVTVFPDTLVTYGDSVLLYTNINLNGANVDSFQWFPLADVPCSNCTQPIIYPTEAAQYYGVQIFTNGCIASDSVLVRVLLPNNFFIPNAFTPNNDGVNDFFYVLSQAGVKVYTFQVFDRWGEKVHDGAFPWDGKFKGKEMPMGAYVYFVRLGLFGDAESITRKGSVTIIR